MNVMLHLTMLLLCNDFATLKHLRDMLADDTWLVGRDVLGFRSGGCLWLFI